MALDAFRELRGGSAPINRQPQTARVTKVDAEGPWVVPIGPDSDQNVPVGPCRGTAGLAVDDICLLVWTQERPWAYAAVAGPVPAHTHDAGDVTSGVFALERLPVAASGSSSSTEIVRADDARLSDARTPTPHGHAAGDITSGTLAPARLPTATTAAAGAVELATAAEASAGTDTSRAITAAGLKAAILALAYPIGTIYESVVNTSPATFLGGTWVAFGTGRTTVGVDTSQTEFNTVEKTGGAKTHTLTAAEMEHRHWTASVTGGSADGGVWNVSDSNIGDATGLSVRSPRTFRINWATKGGTADNSVGYQFGTSSVAGYGTQPAAAAPHNNLQPYITTYKWKRTA